MITCAECIERLYPDDPSIRIGRYHLSNCEHYCNKPTYFRELEQQQPPEVETTVRHVSVYDFASKRQVAKIYALEGQVNYLLKKVVEIQPKRKPKPQSKYT